MTMRCDTSSTRSLFDDQLDDAPADTLAPAPGSDFERKEMHRLCLGVVAHADGTHQLAVHLGDHQLPVAQLLLAETVVELSRAGLADDGSKGRHLLQCQRPEHDGNNGLPAQPLPQPGRIPHDFVSQ